MGGGGGGGGGGRPAEEERPRNSWEVAVGGLGGLAMKYDAGQSVGAAIAARDAKWELSAGQLGQSDSAPQVKVTP